MLRIVAHKSAAAALRYYTEGLAREDYYSEKQEIIGQWHGRAAEHLGLAGDVKREAFAAMAENRHPDTGKPLTPRTKAERRVGYDLNFHAPKSLSILHAMTGDERIVTAFRSAVAETMAEIEALTATRVRRGGAQSERFTGNLAWAEFVHFTGRPVDGFPDPHLHVHAFTFNATHDEVEGRWKAVSWADIKKDGPYSASVFHARLSEKIAAFGFGIERTRHGWEVAGVPRTLIEKFSRRTAQIEELAKQKGITDPKELDGLGAKSREGKRQGMTRSELLAEWRGRMTDAEKALFAKLAPGEKKAASSASMTPDAIFAEVEEKVFAKNSVVEVKHLVAEALRFGVGQLTPEQAWSEFGRRGLVVRDVNGEKLCTSLDVLAEEVSLINFARAGRSRCARISNRPLRFGNEQLSEEQRAAVRHILKSQDQVIGLRGVAGAGKTTLMVEAVAQIEATGSRVFAFAPSADASRGTLRKEGFANADTIAHLLHNQRLQEAVRGQVIWIDEAGLVGARDMLEIMRIAGTATRIILTGDTEQHAPVPRGDPFRLMQHYAGIRVVEVTEIRRQERQDYREAVAFLSKGDLRTGFRRLEQLGAIIEVSDEAERYRLLAEDFLNLSRGPSMPLVISPTHAEGAAVTQAIRAAKREAGQLGPEVLFDQYHDLKWEIPDRRRAENYCQGMMVQFDQNARGFQRGARFIVLGRSDAGGVRIRSVAGGEMELPLQQAERFSVFEQRQIALAKGDRIRITRNGKSADGKRLNNGDLLSIAKITPKGRIILKSGAELEPAHGHFTYGYCQSSHSSQSKSVRDVLVAQSAASFLASSREQFYVSVSRGRQTLRIYTDDVTQLQEAVGNSSQRLAGVELAGFSRKEIAGLMSAELTGQQWRELVQSRRGDGVARTHVQNLLKERRQDALVKSGTMDFRQYINMRRALVGADGKNRSKGHPHAQGHKRQGTQTKGRSFLRPTELTTPTKEKIVAAKQAEPAKKATAPVRPRQNRAAKAFEAGKKHFEKIATRTKTAVQSFKKGVRSKLFPERSPEQIGKQRARKQNSEPAGKAKTVNRTVKKAPAPAPPTPRRGK
jgi:conjugative relaxase-like TrwC/TraI family protein